MFFITFTLMMSVFSAAQGLITKFTVFESPAHSKSQLIIVGGDAHQLGSWQDNVTQFLHFSQLPKMTKLKTLFLVENLGTTNEYFNRPQDTIITQAKQQYVLESLTQNYETPKPAQMPTVLHFFGCSLDFFKSLCPLLGLPDQTATDLSSLPTINVDNRHRNVYYGESLIGWSYPPYNKAHVRAIQAQQSAQLTLLDLLSPQELLLHYRSATSGCLRSIYDEILTRQENDKTNLLAQLRTKFNISTNDVAKTPLAKLAGMRQQELYRYLPYSPLENVLREMVEANALWHITQHAADIIIMLAGTNHTGHKDALCKYQSPGLIGFLTLLGYKQVYDSESLTIPAELIASIRLFSQRYTQKNK